LDDMVAFEPDGLWEIREVLPSGKHAFRWRGWPTEPRYEISTADGYEGSGGDVYLCNRVTVYWTDARGNKVSRIVSTPVPALVADDRIRHADSVTLPDGKGTWNDAGR